MSASDGGEALRLAVEREPAQAVLEVMTHKLDGHEVTRRIRADDATKGIRPSC